MTSLPDKVFYDQLVDHSVRWSLANIDDYDELTKFGPDTLERDGIVYIHTHQREGRIRFIVELIGKAFGDDTDGRTPKGVINYDKTKLHLLVQSCRDVWQSEIVHSRWREPGLFSFRSAEWFQEKILQHPETLKKVGPIIARAGADLFKVLFEDGDDRLTDVANRLRTATEQKDLTLTIYADDFFVPWSMIYTGKRDQPVDKTKFWGYRHIIEHSIDKFHPSAKFQPTNGKIQLGLCYNAGDSEIIKRVPGQIEELKRRANLHVIPRTTDSEVEGAFRSSPYPDGFTQFYVHCFASKSVEAPEIAPPRFRVEKIDITASDILRWIPKSLQSEPFFLLNACEGGQMATLFYESFARDLLERGAKGLIGPQVQIPMVFASAYTERFLKELFDKRPPNRIGSIMRDLAREFWDQHNNPLGLVYSLYRGADCFLPD